MSNISTEFSGKLLRKIKPAIVENVSQCLLRWSESMQIGLNRSYVKAVPHSTTGRQHISLCVIAPLTALRRTIRHARGFCQRRVSCAYSTLHSESRLAVAGYSTHAV